MRITTKYELGQVVYLITDKDQYPYLVVEVIYDGVLTYGLRHGAEETIYRQEFELSDKEDKVFKLS